MCQHCSRLMGALYFYGELVLTKRIFIFSGIIIPLVIHIVITLSYAYGNYDGKNCAGLLDVVWECSELEYYLDWLFNPFTLIALFGYFIISAVLTPIIWLVYKKYNKQINKD